MSDDMKRVVRQDETVVAGAPQQTVVTQTPAVVPGVVPAQTTVATTAPVGDRVIARNTSEAVVDPAAERAATVDWFSRVIWFLAGLLVVLLAIRFVLLATGANQDAGFAQIIYGVTSPFVAPFLGLFGSHYTYPGAAGNGVLEFESLVAIVVWALVAWALTKIAQILLGTNRNRGVAVSDVETRTRV